MVEMVSAIGEAANPGVFGNAENGPAVTICEMTFACLAQVTAFHGGAAAVRRAIKLATGLTVGATPCAGSATKSARACNTAPGTYLVANSDTKAIGKLAKALDNDAGTVTDLSHGRVIVSIDGIKAEWVLAKLFAIDFSDTQFSVNTGLSTSHHEIFASIQRTGKHRFEICVYRSFARSFWQALCHAAAETGYEIKAPQRL